MESLKQERRLPPFDSIGITPPRGRQGHSVPTPRPLSAGERPRQLDSVAQQHKSRKSGEGSLEETKVGVRLVVRGMHVGTAVLSLVRLCTVLD